MLDQREIAVFVGFCDLFVGFHFFLSWARYRRFYTVIFFYLFILCFNCSTCDHSFSLCCTNWNYGIVHKFSNVFQIILQEFFNSFVMFTNLCSEESCILCTFLESDNIWFLYWIKRSMNYNGVNLPVILYMDLLRCYKNPGVRRITVKWCIYLVYFVFKNKIRMSNYRFKTKNVLVLLKHFVDYLFQWKFVVPVF